MLANHDRIQHHMQLHQNHATQLHRVHQVNSQDPLLSKPFWVTFECMTMAFYHYTNIFYSNEYNHLFNEKNGPFYLFLFFEIIYISKLWPLTMPHPLRSSASFGELELKREVLKLLNTKLKNYTFSYLTFINFFYIFFIK